MNTTAVDVASRFTAKMGEGARANTIQKLFKAKHVYPVNKIVENVSAPGHAFVFFQQ